MPDQGNGHPGGSGGPNTSRKRLSREERVALWIWVAYFLGTAALAALSIRDGDWTTLVLLSIVMLLP